MFQQMIARGLEGALADGFPLSIGARVGFRSPNIVDPFLCRPGLINERPAKKCDASVQES